MSIVRVVFPLTWAIIVGYQLLITGLPFDSIRGLSNLCGSTYKETETIVHRWSNEGSLQANIVFINGILGRTEGMLWLSLGLGAIYTALFVPFEHRHGFYLVVALGLLGSAWVQLNGLTQGPFIFAIVSGLLFFYLFRASRRASDKWAVTDLDRAILDAKVARDELAQLKRRSNAVE